MTLSTDKGIMEGYVHKGRTHENSVETDKNTGENAKLFACFKYEQTLTKQCGNGIIFGICALCPFPKALWNE